MNANHATRGHDVDKLREILSCVYTTDPMNIITVVHALLFVPKTMKTLLLANTSTTFPIVSSLIDALSKSAVFSRP